MSHPFFNTSLSGNQLFTQTRNFPPMKDIPNGFSTVGSANSLSSSGASSVIVASYMSGQNKPISNNNTERLEDSVLRSESAERDPLDLKGAFGIRQRKEFFSSATSSTSLGDTDRSAASDNASSDWLPIYRQAAKTDAPKCPSLSLTCCYNQSGERVDNTKAIPGLDHSQNPVPNKSTLSIDSNKMNGATESAAEILQRFGLKEDDLKELHSYPMDQITPQSLSCILQQIYIQKQKRATGKPSEPHPQLRSILKTRKGIDYRHSELEKNSNDSSQTVDSFQTDKVSTDALGSDKTSLINAVHDPSERLEAKSCEKMTKLLPNKVPKCSPLKEPEKGHLVSKSPKSSPRVSGLLNCHSDPKRLKKDPVKMKINQTVVNKDKSKQLTNQKSASEKTGFQTHIGTHRLDDQMLKTPKELRHQGSAEAVSSKPAEVQESFAKPLPTLSEIDDYEGVRPSKFPHTCSLCVKKIETLSVWHNHMAHKNHLKNVEIFKIKYPHWIGHTETLHSKNTKEWSAICDGSQHRQQKSKPESRSHSNGTSSNPGFEGRREESGSGSRAKDTVRRSRSHSHSPGSNQRLKKKQLSSRSRSPSNSPADSHQVKYTPESAAKILQIIGLEKEDLEELDSYAEDQVTPENLHLILRQIFLKKKKKAKATESPSEPKPNTSVTSTDSLNRPETSLKKRPLKPLKGTNDKLSSNSNIVEDKLKQSSKESNKTGGDILPLDNPLPNPCKKKKLQKNVKHIKTNNLDSKNRPVNKPDGDQNKKLKDKLKNKLAKPLKVKQIASKQPQSGAMSASKLKKEACPSGSDPKSTKKKSQGKRAIAVVKEPKVQMEKKNMKKKLKRKNPQNVKGESKPRKASPCISPSKPALIKGSLSNYLPTLAMIKDYAAATPRTFPHTCSICNKECPYMQDWLFHQNSSFHLESCGILRAQYPQWDGDVLPILCADSRSPSLSPRHYYGSESGRIRSRSRSRSSSCSLPSHHSPDGRLSRSRCRSRSSCHRRSGSRSRRRRSISRSRSPYSYRYSQRSQSLNAIEYPAPLSLAHIQEAMGDGPSLAGETKNEPYYDKPTGVDCPWRGVRKIDMSNIRVLTG
ncbi:PREDICTED: zinc finger protein 638-like [Cyprinodon variegatus]|uniref:zinc finger protein 638-like n=1 Tax=Cyprinodon variegatus TaxID=28743 RepID=UPI0007428096|nr:PREDICTED: zinc finger protein 638-like [Cyprinodon variegatus]